MSDPLTTRACVTAACMNAAKGHFCMPCWKQLPWDLKAAITQASKSGFRRKEHVKAAKEFLDDLNATKESQDAATRAGD